MVFHTFHFYQVVLGYPKISYNAAAYIAFISISIDW